MVRAHGEEPLNSGLPRLRQGKDLVRIAYVASVQPGSPEQLVQGELLDLAASGAQVTLFMLSPARRLAQPHAQGVQEVVVELSEQLAAGVSAVAELEARELNALFGSPARTARLLAATALARRLKAQGFTHLHAHGARAAQLAALVHAITRISISASFPQDGVGGAQLAPAFERLEFARFFTHARMNELLSQLPGDAASRSHLIAQRDEAREGSRRPATLGALLRDDARRAAQSLRRPGEPTLSVVTIAKNEERDLPFFLASFLPWVDEVVICDDGSIDRTEEIARSAGPRVRFVRSPRGPGEGFHSQRNKAIDLATGDWLLHVDVDMRLTPELARQSPIRARTSSPTSGPTTSSIARCFMR